MTSVLNPEDMSSTLAATFNARDLNAMTALYDEHAVLIDEAGTFVVFHPDQDLKVDQWGLEGM